MGPDIRGMNKWIRQTQNLAGTFCFYFHMGLIMNHSMKSILLVLWKIHKMYFTSWRNLKNPRGELTDVRGCRDIKNGGGGKIRIRLRYLQSLRESTESILKLITSVGIKLVYKIEIKSFHLYKQQSVKRYIGRKVLFQIKNKGERRKRTKERNYLGISNMQDIKIKLCFSWKESSNIRKGIHSRIGRLNRHILVRASSL